MKKKLSWEEFIKLVKSQTEERGNKVLLANKIGCTPQYIQSILTGKRHPSLKFSRAMGYEKKVEEYYEKID